VSDEELQDEAEWDLKHAEVRGSVKKGRAVVSVSLDRDLFERTAQAAEARGLKTSEFIRAALVEALERLDVPVVHLWAADTQSKVGYSIVPSDQEDVATANVTIEPA
jgi:hypothetical protein